MDEITIEPIEDIGDPAPLRVQHLGEPETAEERAAMAEWAREQAADAMKATLKPVIDGLNSATGRAGDAVALAVMAEHPTLAGQLGRAVAIGIMRRVMRDPNWRPFDPVLPDRSQHCQETRGLGLALHPEHDGRFSCELVIGAEMMARQHFV